MTWRAAVVVLCASAVACASPGERGPTDPARQPPTGHSVERVEVDRVVDGDGLRLPDGREVRLLQVDAPEAGGECYGRQATTELRRLVGDGRVELAVDPDPRVGRVDRYGRLLRYVARDDQLIQLELVRRGAAAPYFYAGERGRYARQLLKAVREARRAGRGAWSACPQAGLRPTSQWQTGSSTASAGGEISTDAAPAAIERQREQAGDQDCSDFAGPVRVLPGDPDQLDANDDGVGCE